MKQETLEDAAERYTEEHKWEEQDPWFDFMEGAKWQAERMYSEEDLKQAINLAFVFSRGMSENETYQDCELFCLEQFKKK